MTVKFSNFAMTSQYSINVCFSFSKHCTPYLPLNPLTPLKIVILVILEDLENDYW